MKWLQEDSRKEVSLLICSVLVAMLVSWLMTEEIPPKDLVYVLLEKKMGTSCTERKKQKEGRI